MERGFFSSVFGDGILIFEPYFEKVHFSVCTVGYRRVRDSRGKRAGTAQLERNE